MGLFTSGSVRAIFFELSPFLAMQGSSKLELLNLVLSLGFVYEQPIYTMQRLACSNGPHDFANVFATAQIVAHHSGNWTPQVLRSCRGRPRRGTGVTNASRPGSRTISKRP